MQTIQIVRARRQVPAGALAVLVSCLSLQSSVLRAELPPLSLDEAVDTALTRAPQIAASDAALDTKAAVAQAAGRLPDPELVAAVDNLPLNTADRFSLTRDFMTMRRIGVMQSFPNRAKRHLQRERAERDIAVARAELAKTRFETARAAADAWIACAVAEESIARLRALQPEIELQAAAGRAALASGRSSAAESLKAQTLVARIEERILSLDQEAEMRRAELARWIGAEANRPLAPIPADRELAREADALIAAVPQHAPIAPVIAQLAATKTDVELARAEKRSDWSTQLSYAQRGPDFSDMVSLEFRVGLPLFATHRQNPIVAGKLATVRAEEARRDAEVRMHTAEVQAMLATWRLGRSRLRHYATELLPLARDRSRAVAASYGSGRGDLRQALEALSEEVDDELEYIALQGTVARAWAFLHLLHDGDALDAGASDRGAAQ